MYKYFNTFVARSPQLPFSILEGNLSEENIILLFNNKIVREAIYVASPELYDELKKFYPEKLSEKDKQRLINAFYKYIRRMCSRCTPFGLFAGCLVGNVSEKTEVIKENEIKTKGRLDMFFMYELYQYISKLPAIRAVVKYYPNTTLYRIHDQYRYIEYKYNKGLRQYFVSAITNSEYIEFILKNAEKGILTNEIFDYLINEGIDKESASSFIEELINSQILISEIAPTITGQDYFNKLLFTLSSLNIEGELLTLLSDIQSSLKKLEDDVIERESVFQDIIRKLKGIDISFNRKYLFQVDFLHNVQKAHIEPVIAEELISVLRFLNKINPYSMENNNLKKFTQKFYERYEEESVSLMEALDPELGINYPFNNIKWDTSKLIDDIIFPTRESLQKEGFVSVPYQNILFRKYASCLFNNEKEIVLTDDDFIDFEDTFLGLPLTISTHFQIIKSKEQPLIKLITCGGISGASILGRFCYLDAKIEDLTKSITKKEQELSSDEIIAEIVHLPESRTGNIVSRPHVRDYELLYMTHSDLDRQNTIPISDLMLSCPGGKMIILYSKKLGKRVLPRLTNAHNFTLANSTPLYRFLCDMQMQTGKPLLFNWGILEKEEFLPRVRYKNTILSPAKWQINSKDLNTFSSIAEDSILIAKLNKWRKKTNIPQYVTMRDKENDVFVNFENILSIRSFLSEIKNVDKVTLSEFLYDKNDPFVKDQENHFFTHECLMFFYKEK